MNKAGFLIFALNLLCGVVFSQELDKSKQYMVSCIGFYNVENLFDTIDSPDTNDAEYLPEGDNKWTTEKYNKKLENLSEVISQLVAEITPEGPAVLGLAEVENRTVLEDLVKTEKLKPFGYDIVHYDSPDRRGVDVALLYQPRYFKVVSSNSFTLKLENDTGFYTRDQLLVTGVFDSDTMHVMVAHWPSRRGGEKKSAPLRNAAAALARSVIDSLFKINENARIIFMGDLNDDPVNESLKKYMKTNGSYNKLNNNELFNPMENLYKKGIGSLAYRDSWNLFDQVLLSPSLVNNGYKKFGYYSARVFNKNFVCQQEGSFKGYPLRTFAGGAYTAGYSDHFAVYVVLAKEKP
jgi:hypothetical protein